MPTPDQKRIRDLVNQRNRLQDQLVATRKHFDEMAAEASDLVGQFLNTLATVYKDLESLHTDMVNGCSVEVAGREIVRVLHLIRQVTEDKGRGQDDESR